MFPSQNIFSNLTTKFLQVLSINYDYLPTSVESPRQIFIDLIRPPPLDLKVGSPVRLHEAPGIRVRNFTVDDISGSRIVLIPFVQNGRFTFNPIVHNCNGWGYNTATLDVSTSHHSVAYGYGMGRAQLEYLPTHTQSVPNPENFYYALF